MPYDPNYHLNQDGPSDRYSPAASCARCDALAAQLTATEAENSDLWCRLSQAQARLADAESALRYIVERYGKLGGVGWDRVLADSASGESK
jgi:hypothetical protein